MEEKPKIFQNKVTKEFQNNKKIYTSYNKKENVISYNNQNIKKKIRDIITSNTFIYSKIVNIVIDNKTIARKIIGINNNNLITIDNERIPLDNIKDIYI